MRPASLPVVLLALWLGASTASAAPQALDAATYRDKVYACWLGKSIGGTLGAPLEGRREMHDLKFFDPVPTQQTPNDDLDLQLLWLKALEERGPRIDAKVLGEYWLSYVPVDWNEYGIGKANMRAGFLPPLSGQYRNTWKDSNGAWIRSEIWACVAPGCPSLAARYAWEDACVDHGGAEGTYAEVFTAALESAAFVEPRRDELIRIGLTYIPEDCAVSRSIRAAVEAHRAGLDLRAARESVVAASSSTGWFMAPQNVAFVILGWLYGDGDFGRSICAAVNCGDDTDCTGATLGSLLGIIGGTAAIPDEWRRPVGEGISNVAIAGFQPPRNVAELTDLTVAMAERVLAECGAGVRLAESAPAPDPAAWPLTDPAAASLLWARSPYSIQIDRPAYYASLDYGGEPEVSPGQPLRVSLTFGNKTPHALEIAVTWRVPDGVSVDPLSAVVAVPAPGDGPAPVAGFTLRATGDTPGSALRGTIELSPVGRPSVDVIPFAVGLREGVHAADLALASRGAKATSDSELDRDPGCTMQVIDGIVTSPDDFEGRRWHSALTPHPHWVAVELPDEGTIRRVVLHFADPGGYPVDFTGEVSSDGTAWRTVFEEAGWADARRCDRAFGPVAARFFRFVIRKSASPRWPDAAQLSEIEILP